MMLPMEERGDDWLEHILAGVGMLAFVVAAYIGLDFVAALIQG